MEITYKTIPMGRSCCFHRPWWGVRVIPALMGPKAPCQYVERSVVVSIHLQATPAAPEYAVFLRPLCVSVAAAGASYRDVGGVDLYKLAAGPFCLVAQPLSDQSQGLFQQGAVEPCLLSDVDSRFLDCSLGRGGHVPELQVLYLKIAKLSAFCGPLGPSAVMLAFIGHSWRVG